MKKWIFAIASAGFLAGCGDANKETMETDDFDYRVEQFADLEILRYQVPGFEQLSLNQKKLVCSRPSLNLDFYPDAIASNKQLWLFTLCKKTKVKASFLAGNQDLLFELWHKRK